MQRSIESLQTDEFGISLKAVSSVRSYPDRGFFCGIIRRYNEYSLSEGLALWYIDWVMKQDRSELDRSDFAFDLVDEDNRDFSGENRNGKT